MTENGEPAQPPGDGDLVEGRVAEYLEAADRGATPELQAFLSTVPAERREECRERIQTALQVARALGEAGGAGAAVEGPPRIAGFRIQGLIGQGGLGTVYAAWDEALRRKVAVKVLRRQGAGTMRERILDEARKAAGLKDPAIITIHSVVVDGDSPAIVMEHVEGHPIDQVAAPLTFRQKAKLLEAVAGALSVAHAKGIIHRDLKPENVLVTLKLEPKVLDFGLAISPREGEGRPGLFEGTPHYASPEQIRGERLASASDVYSFGALMFAVLTGRPPFQGATLEEILAKVTTIDPPFPRNLAASVPEDLQAICLACLARDPGHRPGAREVAADLGRYLAGEPARLRPALYGDILRRRIEEHQEDLRNWREQGMISAAERDRLQLVYRRILADEDHWIVDARKLSLPQTVLYTGTWMAVVASALLVWLVRQELSSAARWLIPAAASALLLLLGLRAQARREALAAASFLAGAILALVPTLLSMLAELGILSLRPEGVEQLLDPPFSNLQVLAACLSGLGLSALAWWRLRLTGFAWTTAALAAASYLGGLLIAGWLDFRAEAQALLCLPLAALEGAALRCERVRRFRWALPFHIIALVALVASLDVMAWQGPTLEMLGLGRVSFLDPARSQNFSLALNGLVFLALMVFTERARSLDLRLGSKVLELLAVLHLLGPLYSNAQSRRGAPGVAIDVGIYLAAVCALLLLGPWRSRKRFLLGGLAGIALGSYLLVDLALVSKPAFVIGLGLLGLLAALATYLYLPRAGGRS